MAMTLRFDDDNEVTRLRAAAAAEGVSMNEFVRRSVHERLERMSVLQKLREAWGPLPADAMDDVHRAAASLGIAPDRAAELLGLASYRAAS